MRRIISILIFFSISFYSFAGRISGSVTDDKGAVLPFASIFIKGTTKGTTANNDGKYFLDLNPGTYTIICQHVGYNREEKTLTVTEENIIVNFKLSPQELTMK